MGGGFKVHKKFNFVLTLLKLYILGPLIFFSIQLWYKNLFLLFLVNSLGEERERSSDSSGKKRKMSLTQISVTKMVDLCVK